MEFRPEWKKIIRNFREIEDFNLHCHLLVSYTDIYGNFPVLFRCIVTEVITILF